MNKKAGTTCEIKDGIQMAVYQSQNGKKIVVHAFSGSEGWLSFYNAETCRLTATLSDINPDWRMKDEKLVSDGHCDPVDCSGPQCTCCPSRVYEMDSQCNPTLLENDSIELTKKNFGVGFSKQSLIAHPRTPQAKILKQGVE